MKYYIGFFMVLLLTTMTSAEDWTRPQSCYVTGCSMQGDIDMGGFSIYNANYVNMTIENSTEIKTGTILAEDGAAWFRFNSLGVNLSPSLLLNTKSNDQGIRWLSQDDNYIAVMSQENVNKFRFYARDGALGTTEFHLSTRDNQHNYWNPTTFPVIFGDTATTILKTEAVIVAESSAHPDMAIVLDDSTLGNSATIGCYEWFAGEDGTEERVGRMCLKTDADPTATTTPSRIEWFTTNQTRDRVDTANPQMVLNSQGSLEIDGNMTITERLKITGYNDGNIITENYDIDIGEDYGAIEIGEFEIFQSDLIIGAMNLNGTAVFRNEHANTPTLQFLFATESSDIRLAIPKSGGGLATQVARSLMVGGDNAQAFNDSIVNCSAQGYSLINCDTDSSGADVGIADDLEVRGTAFIEENITIGIVGKAGMIKIRDTDDSGWTCCTYLNGAQSCVVC